MGSIQSHFFQVAEIKIKNEDIRHGLRITRLSSNINIRFQIDPNAREIEPFRFASQSTEPDRLPKAKQSCLDRLFFVGTETFAGGRSMAAVHE